MFSLWGLCSPDGIDVCKNGAICSVAEDNSMQCVCPPGFEGNFCEIGITFYIYQIDYLGHILTKVLPRPRINICHFISNR